MHTTRKKGKHKTLYIRVKFIDAREDKCTLLTTSSYYLSGKQADMQLWKLTAVDRIWTCTLAHLFIF